MSAGDVVCTGWLIKSPPEKKLKRFAWRKRWFVLRRGRMSGNPDVLEYYQSKNSKKPIRTIDLKECEVEMPDGQLRIKRDFHGKHLFVVKTSSRVFYLLAKTEEEMHSWIKSIDQICHFRSPEEAESSEEGSLPTPISVQPSPDSSDRASVASQPESSPPQDYLFLSQCKTGSGSTIGCDSFSTSDISLEQKSLDDTIRDMWTESSSSSITHLSQSPCPQRRVPNSPFSAPCSFSVLPSSSSSPLRPCVTDVFQFDRPFSCASFEAAGELQTPPPLPPKPCHLSEQQSDGGAPRSRSTSLQQFPGNIHLFSRRISLSGLDHLRRGNMENIVIINRRQSVNLPCLNDTHLQSYQDESYVPMTSPSAPTAECDGYIPMSPRTLSFLSSNCSVESSPSISSLTCQPAEFVPPPVHRHLKPRPRKVRPPPLDLTGLSTITECPTHLPISRTKTQPCFSVNHSSFDYRPENGETPRDEPGIRSAMESRPSFCLPFDGASQYGLSSPSRLDYLSLDFNSATPSPVQKKPFLSDEYRVDYVQVDEKKTQALQNTKMEWSDNRLSKT